jgi:hypothetical protein
MLIFALTGQRQCADGHDQFDQAHPQFSVSDTLEIRSIAPPEFHPLDIIFQPFQAPPGLGQENGRNGGAEGRSSGSAVVLDESCGCVFGIVGFSPSLLARADEMIE